MFVTDFQQKILSSLSHSINRNIYFGMCLLVSFYDLSCEQARLKIFCTYEQVIKENLLAFKSLSVKIPATNIDSIHSIQFNFIRDTLISQFYYK